MKRYHRGRTRYFPRPLVLLIMFIIQVEETATIITKTRFCTYAMHGITANNKSKLKLVLSESTENKDTITATHDKNLTEVISNAQTSIDSGRGFVTYKKSFLSHTDIVRLISRCEYYDTSSSPVDHNKILSLSQKRSHILRSRIVRIVSSFMDNYNEKIALLLARSKILCKVRLPKLNYGRIFVLSKLSASAYPIEQEKSFLLSNHNCKKKMMRFDLTLSKQKRPARELLSRIADDEVPNVNITPEYYGAILGENASIPALNDNNKWVIEMHKALRYCLIWSVDSIEFGARRKDVTTCYKKVYVSTDDEYEVQKNGDLIIKNITSKVAGRQFWLSIDDQLTRNRRYICRYHITVIDKKKTSSCGKQSVVGKIGETVSVSCAFRFFTKMHLESTKNNAFNAFIQNPIHKWVLFTRDGHAISLKSVGFTVYSEKEGFEEVEQIITASLSVDIKYHQSKMVCQVGHANLLSGSNPKYHVVNICDVPVVLLFDHHYRKEVSKKYFAFKGENVNITCPWICSSGCNYTFTNNRTSKILHQGLSDTLLLKKVKDDLIITCRLYGRFDAYENLRIQVVKAGNLWDALDYGIVFLLILNSVLIFMAGLGILLRRLHSKELKYHIKFEDSRQSKSLLLMDKMNLDNKLTAISEHGDKRIMNSVKQFDDKDLQKNICSTLRSSSEIVTQPMLLQDGLISDSDIIYIKPAEVITEDFARTLIMQACNNKIYRLSDIPAGNDSEKRKTLGNVEQMSESVQNECSSIVVEKENSKTELTVLARKNSLEVKEPLSVKMRSHCGPFKTTNKILQEKSHSLLWEKTAIKNAFIIPANGKELCRLCYDSKSSNLKKSFSLPFLSKKEVKRKQAVAVNRIRDHIVKTRKEIHSTIMDVNTTELSFSAQYRNKISQESSHKQMKRKKDYDTRKIRIYFDSDVEKTLLKKNSNSFIGSEVSCSEVDTESMSEDVSSDCMIREFVLRKH